MGWRRLLAGGAAFAVLLVLASFLLFKSSASTNNPTPAQAERQIKPSTGATTSPAVVKADIIGTWKWTSSFGKRTGEATLRITPEGNRLNGAVFFGESGRSVPVENLTFRDGSLSFTMTYEGKKGKYVNRFEGKVSGDTIQGKMTFDVGGRAHTRDWEAKRVKE